MFFSNKKMNILIRIIFSIILFISISINAFPIPKDKKVTYDVIRKNKVIGTHQIEFIENEDTLLVKTDINVKVTVLFVTAYKFSHQSTETWSNGDFIKIDAHSDFEDEREYFIKGYDKDDYFLASGMDGELKLSKNILPSNFWNIKVLHEKEIFDTQKGIVRKITVEDKGAEKITINNQEIECNKYTLNASTNPKDKGPFPEYTLWYSIEKNELMKFKFLNWKDKKIVTLVRNYQEKN